MSSKNVFKNLFKKKTDKNTAREEETGNKTAGNNGTNLPMGASTNVSGIGTAMNQGPIESYEGTTRDMDDKKGNDDKDGVDDAKEMILVPSPGETNLVHNEARAQGFEQSARRMKDVAYEAVKESLRTVVRCSDAFPPLKSAGQAILEVVERYDAVKEIPKELAQLNEKLRLLVEILESGSRDMNDDRLGGLARTFNEKARLIAQKLNRPLGTQIIETSQDRAFIAGEISSVMFAVDIAMLDVNLRTYKSVSQLQETVLELNVRALLDKLKYVDGASYNHEDRQGCTNGTRIMLLADMLTWATDPKNEHVCWLNGMAGTGKTTVAETFCNLLFHRGLLGSSFFCSRKKLDRQNVRLIIPALAKGLACAYPEFQTELLEVLKVDLNFSGLGLEDQYLTLILQPAEKAFANSSKTIVLVIDALDECEDTQAAEVFLKTVLLRKPTCDLRLLVTSRPEPKVLKGFRSGDHASLRLQDIEVHLVKADIAVFLSNKLKEIEELYDEYVSTWPPAGVQTIVDQSGTLFIYAATAVKYISDEHGDPVERLAKFASIRPPVNAVEGIDEVYAYVLAEAFSQNLDNAEMDRIKTCLSMVVCALEPMSVNTYSVLLGITPTQVRRAFSALHSVVQVPDNKQNGEVIMLYHTSFSDYLLSNTRSISKSWLIDLAAGHSDLGSLCLNVMMSKLHFNIAHASTSYKSNLDQSLKVDPYWNYAAIYWVDHIVSSMQPLEWLSASLIEKIVQFLKKKYLYWLEILSVLNRVQVAPAAMYALSKRTAPQSNLAKLCSEFASFVSTYLVPIQTSVPHIYLSAFSWSPPKSQLKSLYSSKFSHLPFINDQSKTHEHESLLLQLTGHSGAVTCVAFASNNIFIVSGSEDRTLRVWNALTGEETLKPFYGHTEKVTTVAISPDCQYIASGSADNSVRVWHTATGKPVWKPLQNNREVTSVVFSSDGKLLLSSSNDTIYLWDAEQGGEPLQTFQSSGNDDINCVAFSPDCKTIASGSFGPGVYFWNISTGQQITRPLKELVVGVFALDFSPNGAELLIGASVSRLHALNIESSIQSHDFIGHTGSVMSAKYSKDGKCIVSGSDDGTVRVWDASTGKEICRPLQGHTNKVTSVSYSGDGKCIASASWDRTVRVWKAQTSDTFDPVQGHSNYVKTAVFSAGNEYVLSGSNDQTICVWDMKRGDLKMTPLIGHTSTVTTLAVSPDNKYIFSSSSDGTLRAWDFTTGTEVIHPVQGLRHRNYGAKVVINTSNNLIASCSYMDTSLKVWSSQTGELQVELSSDESDYFLGGTTFSPNGQYLAYGSKSGAIRIWELSTLNLQATIFPENSYPTVNEVAFSFEGTYIAYIHEDTNICIYDFKIGKIVLGPLKGHSDFIHSLVYSPCGKYLASGSSDNNVCLWEAKTGQQILGPFYGHAHRILTVDFSSDSKYLVSGGLDRMVRIWIVENTGAADQESRKFLHNYPAETFIFQKDGWVLTADNQLFMWIPQSKLHALYTPQTYYIFGEEKITIDLSEFAHGTGWDKIKL